MSECGFDGCSKPVKAVDLCGMHLSRLYRNGDPAAVRRRRPIYRGSDVGEFITANADIRDTNECIEWKGARTVRGGYGVFTCAQKDYLAHRVSYEVHVGPIPNGMLIRHKCDNPPCVNPKHLEIGTDALNVADMINRGRNSRGEDHTSAKLKQAEAMEILRLCSERNVSHVAIAEMFGVSRATVGDIGRRRSWKHLTP